MSEHRSYGKRKRPALDPRIMLDYIMAALWISLAVFIMFSKELFNSDFFEGNDLVQGWWKWFIGLIFMLYGLFRIYRGYQLQKERQRED
jgi:hypothetical protein